MIVKLCKQSQLIGLFVLFAAFSCQNALAQAVQTTCSASFPLGWVIINEYWASSGCGVGYTPGPGAINTYVIEDILLLPVGSTVTVCAVQPVLPGWSQVGPLFLRPTQCSGWQTPAKFPNMKQIKRVQ